VHYVLGGAALVLSVSVASKRFITADIASPETLAWFLGVATGLITFFGAQQRGDRYQRAFRILSSEIALFLADRTGRYEVKDVINAYNRGEDIIHQTAADDRSRTQPTATSPTPPGTGMPTTPG
jgi:hypothetical protein